MSRWLLEGAGGVGGAAGIVCSGSLGSVRIASAVVLVVVVGKPRAVSAWECRGYVSRVSSNGVCSNF